MEIEVWSVGKTKFTADTEYQEPMIREVIDQRGDVAEVIADYTDTERSNISCDDYARVTGDLPGLVLFEGWLTGDRDAPPPASALTAGEQAAVVAARHAAEAGLPPEAAAVIARAVPEMAAALDGLNFERGQVTELRAVVLDMARSIRASMNGGGRIARSEVIDWMERAGVEFDIYAEPGSDL
jgi:hypothetical protein